MLAKKEKYIIDYLLTVKTLIYISDINCWRFTDERKNKTKYISTKGFISIKDDKVKLKLIETENDSKTETLEMEIENKYVIERLLENRGEGKI